MTSFFYCFSVLSLGSEFFKGAPGGRGRPGNAGFKGLKGAVPILFIFNLPKIWESVQFPQILYTMFWPLNALLCTCRWSWTMWLRHCKLSTGTPWSCWGARRCWDDWRVWSGGRARRRRSPRRWRVPCEKKSWKNMFLKEKFRKSSAFPHSSMCCLLGLSWAQWGTGSKRP